MACPTLPTFDHEARADRIEAALYHALGHLPCSSEQRARPDRDDPPPERLFSSALLAQLRDSLSALAASGAALAAVPEGYPLWVTLIIRSVAALLPWHTRSLHAYAQAVSETAAATAAVLEDAERRAREAVR